MTATAHKRDPELQSSADIGARLADGGGMRAGILLRGGFSIGAKTSSFVATVVLIRVLGPEETGSFLFAMSLGVVLGLLLAAGLGEAMGREVPMFEAARKDDESGSLLFAALKIGGFVCAGVGALMFLLANQIGGERGALIMSALIVGIGLSAQGVGGSFLRARGRYTLAELWQGGVPTLFLVSVGLLAISMGLDGTEALRLRMGLEVAAGVGAVGCAIAFATGRKGSGGAQGVGRLLKLSAPLWVTNLCWLALQQSDVVVLGLLKSSHDVGLYVPILKVAEMSALPLVAMTPYLLTNAARSRNDSERLQHLVATSAKWSFALASPLLGVLFLAPRELINLVFGIEGQEVATVARLLVVAFVALALFGVTEPILQGVGKVRLLAVRSFWLLAIAISMNLVMVAHFGAVGAAGATAFAYVALATYNLFLIRTRYEVRLLESELRKVVAIAAASAVVTCIALRITENELLSVVVAGALVGLPTLTAVLTSEGSGLRGLLRRATFESSDLVEVG